MFEVGGNTCNNAFQLATMLRASCSNLLLVLLHLKSPAQYSDVETHKHCDATKFVVCKLKSVVGRITTHLKHCDATKFRCCKLKKFVEKSRRQFNLMQHATSTCNNIFCCVTMFELGGNTCNNAFQLATQQCCVQVVKSIHFLHVVYL